MSVLTTRTATCRQLPLFGPEPPAPYGPPPAPSARVQRSLPAPALTGHASLSAAITAFADHLAARRDVTQRTRWALLRDLDVAGRLLGLSREVGSLTPSDLERVQEQLYDTAKPSTVERRLSTLSQFVHWLKSKGCVNTRLRVAVPKAAEELPTVLSPDQVQALLRYTAERGAQSAAGARQAFLVRLLLATAMKRQDVIALRVDDLALDADPPQITVGQGDRARRIAAPADLELRRFWQAYANAFVPGDMVFACSDKMLERDLAEASAALKWAHVLGFSTLRWTAALRDLRGGKEPERLRLKLGLSEMQWKETLGLLRRLAV